MTSKAKAAVLITAIITAGIIILSFAPSAKADASSHRDVTQGATTWQAPRCLEDQVISRRLRCLDRDDRTTRYVVVSEAGWGYWVDTRYPRAMSMRPLVPACHKWQMVTRYGGCVGARQGDFRGGWWYRR